MKKIRDILVIMDLPKSRQLAMDRGVTLAEQLGARLHLISFVHHDMYEQREVFDKTQREAVREALVAERQRWLDEKLQSFSRGEIAVQAEVVWSKRLHDWVNEAVETRGFGLVLKSAHDSKTLVHTPTDWHLLRECAAPVLIATRSRWPAKARVVAAVDPTGKDKAQTRLNDRVVKAALAFANSHDADVHLAWTVHAPEVLADLDIIDPRAYRKRLIDSMTPRLEKLADTHGIARGNIHTPKGRPDVALTGLAAKLKAELIVLGTTARKGVSGLLVGNTAEKVLTGARCDILAIKP